MRCISVSVCLDKSLKATEVMNTLDNNTFPIVNLSDDGWSTDDEATATCFCGAVQLILVSTLMLTLAWNIAILCSLLLHLIFDADTHFPATPETRSNQPIHLPLHRLPQNRFSLVPIQHHGSRLPSQAHTRRRQPRNIRREQNDSCQRADDELLLQDVWDADVSPWCSISWNDDSKDWNC